MSKYYENFKSLIYIFLLILMLLCSSVNAIKIGEEKPSLVDNVIVTNENWADCISSVDYAYKKNGIILQTESNSLNPNVKNLIKSINPKRIIIIGGPQAISYNVEDELKKYSDVVRIWGDTRITTNEKILNLLKQNNVNVLVNGYNFNEVILVSKERHYNTVYAEIRVYNPNKVIRVYNNNTVKIYTLNKKLIGTFKKDEVLEVPKKIIVLIKPEINAKYCDDENIAEFGYKLVNIPNYYVGIPITKDDPTSLLLSRYLNVPVVMGNYTKPILRLNSTSPINNSITVAVDILVLKKTKEIYNNNDNNNLEQALNEAKTQLWSKNIPVERYNIPFDYLKDYVKH